jgi:predicted AAA+ superfamily ATPase
MGHWSGKEMQTAFGWSAEQYAWFGGYPASGTLIQEEERWKAYVRDSLIETSISKDILMMSRIDKPALMRRLFELGCVYSGQILSLTKLIGQLQDRGNTTTLSHYLDILNTAGLLCGIEKFTPDLARQRASSPKFQVHNTALISAQRHESFSEISSKPEEWGRIVESAVGAHLLNQSITSNCNLYYWRDRNDEVDFIIEKGDKIMAIEVKSGLNQSKKGMDTFARKYQPYKVLLVGQSGIPWQEFLQLDLLEIFH